MVWHPEPDIVKGMNFTRAIYIGAIFYMPLNAGSRFRRPAAVVSYCRYSVVTICTCTYSGVFCMCSRAARHEALRGNQTVLYYISFNDAKHFISSEWPLYSETRNLEEPYFNRIVHFTGVRSMNSCYSKRVKVIFDQNKNVILSM